MLIAQIRLRRRKRFYASAATMREQLPQHQDASRARPPRSLRRHLRVDETDVEGFPCFTLTPRSGVRTDLHIVHFHGGGFVESPESHHWHFARRIVDALGCRYTLPMYPLAPSHDHRRIVPFALAGYEQITRDTPAHARVLFGDSAGGSMALTIAQDLRDHDRPQPACIALFSPWLNLATDDPESILIDPTDPELGIEGLRQAGRWYAADKPLDDPYLSPAHADLDGLAPIAVFVGTRDILMPDATMLRRDAAVAGVPLDLHIHGGMFHNWIMKRIPEARTATRQLLDFLDGHRVGTS
ncbi:alpha/beta hydrolase fold domain-containing protein [Williamsia sp. SKLECPSW1]